MVTAEGAGAAGDEASIELSSEERELVAEELEAFVPALAEGPRQATYRALQETVPGGAVPAHLLDALGSVLELALQTARARKLYRAEGEKILTGLFRRTPRGRELSAHLKRVNEALRALSGHELAGAKVRMRTLGHFTLMLETDGPTVTLAFRPDGVEVEKIAVGG